MLCYINLPKMEEFNCRKKRKNCRLINTIDFSLFEKKKTNKNGNNKKKPTRSNKNKRKLILFQSLIFTMIFVLNEYIPVYFMVKRNAMRNSIFKFFFCSYLMFIISLLNKRSLKSKSISRMKWVDLIQSKMIFMVQHQHLKYHTTGLFDKYQLNWKI